MLTPQLIVPAPAVVTQYTLSPGAVWYGAAVTTMFVLDELAASVRFSYVSDAICRMMHVPLCHVGLPGVFVVSTYSVVVLLLNELIVASEPTT